MKKKYFFWALFLLSPLAVVAQKNKGFVNVSGKYELRMERNYCVGDAFRAVEDMAIIDALQKNFGASVVQGTDYFMQSSQSGNKETTTNLLTINTSTVVKGEWIQTTKKNIEWVLKEEGKGANKTQELWLVCQIEGRARELEEVKVDFEAHTLNCTQAPQCRTVNFQNNEPLYMSFKSAQPGFLSIYMKEQDKVFRLFPYSKVTGQHESALPVVSDKEYMLFSTKNAKDFAGLNAFHVDEYQLSTNNQDRLSARIYVVFTPDAQDKPIFDSKDGMKTISPEKFVDWLNKNRAQNPKFQVQNIDVVITR